MNQAEVESITLKHLYEAFFGDERSYNLHRIREEVGWDYGAYWKVVDYLTHQHLIKGWTMGGNYIITSYGILHAEENGLAQEELQRENQRIRTAALDILANVHEESGSPFANAHIQTLTDKMGVDAHLLVKNLRVLEDLEYVEPVTTGSFKITYKGLDAVKEWRQQLELAAEFERVSEMSPQPRGRALQKLFAKVVEKYGWSQEEGARTPHEEMDVVVHKEREYYLVECKWEKDHIEAPVVRELFGKLNNREGVQGMIVSMSGYTSGAIQQAEEYANSRVILFFGPEDVRSLVYERSSFDTLLNSKYQQLITRRKVVFD